ncbi:hypothetical protein LX32DRAFT_724534 [Colletotrichum zoysiae]|uniref:Uncharacterized protein n=1 Tax=Colletotrichum zoysiae TaxID=1216348 RepID=A0AAD9HSC0_9PEZI|nr:hypothetical protein LX32DRAFT_724534 [Colletotrichum zoysiae]
MALERGEGQLAATNMCARRGRRSEAKPTANIGAINRVNPLVMSLPTRAAPKTETRPKKEENLKCYAESDFSGHKKVSKGDKRLEEAMGLACDKLHEVGEPRPGQKWDKAAYQGGKLPYKPSVEWPENCSMEQRAYPTALLVELVEWSKFWAWREPMVLPDYRVV